MKFSKWYIFYNIAQDIIFVAYKTYNPNGFKMFKNYKYLYIAEDEDIGILGMNYYYSNREKISNKNIICLGEL